MSSRRFLTITTILAFLILIAMTPSFGIPAFARKYGFNCEMCHVSWPALNDFGQKFRWNGYNIPGQENLEKTLWELGGPPIAFRTMAGYTIDSFSPNGAGDEVNQFQINGLDVLGGGVLGFRKGFFVAYLPRIEPTNGVEAQDAEVEQANVVFSYLRSTWLNVRVGRFETAVLPFSVLRSITISPYEIYEFDGGLGSANRFSLASTTDGIEIVGYGKKPWQYAFGWVNGSRANLNDQSPADVYIRGAYILGPGMGQSSGQRFGAIAYFGKARPADNANLTDKRESFSRVGFDANLNKGQWNVLFQYLQGRDSSAFNLVGTGDYKFSGGFLQLNHYHMGSAHFLRYDWVNTPSSDNHDISRITIGMRQHIEHDLMLQLEYSHRKVDNGGGAGLDVTENFAAARLDWAF